MQLKFYTFWAINGALDERLLCQQLDQMRQLGFDGAVFHPRFYPNEPPYLSDEYLEIVSRTILHAKSIGMEFWLYDENGWPSGTVGGELLIEHPDDRQQWADLTLDGLGDVLASFEHDGQSYQVLRRLGDGVDYLSPNLAGHFLTMTYERYRTGLAPEAFEYVSAFFSDEPEFGLGHAFDHLSPLGAIPWTTNLPAYYFARNRASLEADLPSLFFDIEGYEQVRLRFWETLTDLFSESFVGPIDAWCQQHGKRFTAHVKGEEHPLFQVPTSGSCHQIFQHLALPGIDALERYPSGHFFPRQVASVAQQFGTGDCMAECFGGAGWGATPLDFERYICWLAGHGINHFVVHLYQYKLTSNAIHDWPASTPAHVTWRDAFPQVLANVRRFAETPSTDADTLVIAPYRSIMSAFEPNELLTMNIHNASTYPDTPAGRCNRDFLELLNNVHESGAAYHVADERTVDEHGRFENGKLVIGNCAYSRVIVASGAQLSAGAEEAVATVKDAGNVAQVAVTNTHAVANSSNIVSVPVSWSLAAEPTNSLPLEPHQIASGEFIASFAAAQGIDIDIVFADDVSGLLLNGVDLKGGLGRTIHGASSMTFRAPEAEANPVARLDGRFRVMARGPFTPGPNGTLQVDAPFTLLHTMPFHAANLTESGFPFCGQPVLLNARIDLPIAATRLQLAGAQADCAQIFVDGADCGWCWGPDFAITLAKPLDAGEHVIEVKLVPSTFNLYGPHHHIDGDIHIVSPTQYDYCKNFADRPDAPANTRVAQWHVKPFGLPAAICIVS
jgi:hypothetical protein